MPSDTSLQDVSMGGTATMNGNPRLADFHAVNKGGGLFSEATGQWIGAVFARTGYRLGLAPTALTLVNLVIGLSSSVAVIVLAPRAAAGTVAPWVVGLIALVGWQIAYALDCADGQLARLSGRTSVAGARVDVLCDVASQIALVSAVSAVTVAFRPTTPVWLITAFVGTWMVNLVTSVMANGPAAASMVPSRSTPVRVVKLVRDPGAVMALFGVILTVVPEWTIAPLIFFTAVNGIFLLASIAFSARAGLKA
jgi:phosphatidylglycerophosphate synthase